MNAAEVWTVIAVLGIGTYVIRLSFLGLSGRRPWPAWVLRHLRYTPVALLPGLVAPLVVWPAATGGVPEPARAVAAVVTLAVGLWTKSVLAAMVAGAGALYAILWLAG